MHLPLSAGRMVMLGSLLSAEIAFLSSMVILEEYIFALVRVADTLSWICSASEELSLLILIADSVAVMRSTVGSCCGEMAKFRPFPSTSLSGLVRGLCDRFLNQLS